MEKSVIITIMVDNVPLSVLEGMLEALEKVIASFDSKRISVNIVDDKLVMRP